MSYVNQNIYTTVSQPSLTWRQDYRLQTPILLGPPNGGNVCGESYQFLSGDGSGVVLAWRAVPDADFYVVQWCRNSSFTGPTAKAITVSDPTVVYELLFGLHIRLGAQYYWRIIAYSNDGGVSDTSATFSFTFDCPNGENPTPQELDPYYNDTPLCQFFNVELNLTGANTAKCCTEEKYTISVSWDCLTPEGNSLTIESIDWNVGTSPGISLLSADNIDYAVVDIAPGLSESFNVSVCVRFTDSNGLVFTCCDSKNVTVDCGDSADKGKVCLHPWPGLIRAIHEDYVDPPIQSSAWNAAFSALEANAANSAYTFWISGWVFESYTLQNPSDYKMYDPTGANICLDGYFQDPASQDTNKECIGRGMDAILKHEARIPIPIGCTLTVEDGYLQVDFNRIIGDHLTWDEINCVLESTYGGGGYLPGCGLIVNPEDNKVWFNPLEVAGPGLSWTGENCGLQATLGCGLYFDASDNISVYVPDLLGVGLKNPRDGCKVAVDYDCGIKTNELGSLVFDAYSVAGLAVDAKSGLINPESCLLEVKTIYQEFVTNVYCSNGDLYKVTSWGYFVDKF